MRDDLHRTVPLARHWRRVLRLAGREADWDRVPQELVRAVVADLNQAIDGEWASAFASSCRNQVPDMFSTDGVDRALNSMQSPRMTSLERELLETAKGLRARGVHPSELFDRSRNVVAQQQADRSLEHVLAEIRKVHGVGQEKAARVRLKSLAVQCDFSNSAATLSESPVNFLDVKIGKRNGR